MLKNKTLFLLLAFTEGSAVMATELISAKLLAPYFGSTLYVWSTVMAITLGGLALGYFIGGFLSTSTNKTNILLYLLFLASFLIILMPISTSYIVNITIHFNIIPAVITSSTLIILLPMFLMGCVSPLLVSILADENNQSGKIAGTIFAVSTLGGIISTFLMGFYIIPTYGLSNPCFFVGILLSILPSILLFKKDKIPLLFLLLSVTYIGLSAPKNIQCKKSDNQLIYNSEGVLGQLMIVDFTTQTGITRKLFNNRICQSSVDDFKRKEKYLDYVEKISSICKTLPNKSKILLLGLGGGNVANMLVDSGFIVDAVDIDDRLPYIATTFFGLKPAVNTIIDDARHYIKTSNKKYDAIIFDVFSGEENPNHIITQESLNETKNRLADNAIILINANGYWKNEIGKGTRSIAKTCMYSGFNVTAFPTSTIEQNRNIVLLISKKKLAENQIKETEVLDAIVLTDDKPVLDKLNLQANLAWRKGYIAYFNTIQ